MKFLLTLGVLAATAVITPTLAQTTSGGTAGTSAAVTRFIAPSTSVQLDFANAKAVPLPQAKASPGNLLQLLQSAPANSGGAAGFSAGSVGSGLGTPTTVPFKAAPAASNNDEMAPQEFGSSGQPYTTSKVNNTVNVAAYYPFRASGKLFFQISGSTYVCSASMIKPGVLVTAAHCVANFGHSQFYSGWTYIPSYTRGDAPYGTWTAGIGWVMTSYYNGSDSCYQSGVVCQNDVAVLIMRKQNNTYVGSITGWLGYGWNGYSYNSSSQALITQLGFPVALDGGLVMERNESQGVTNSTYSNNTIIGSLMTGGSSGGPWVVNLGFAPTLSGNDANGNPFAFGNAPLRNIVVGVTSWGFNNGAIKQQGASPFTTGNITILVNTACSYNSSAC